MGAVRLAFAGVWLVAAGGLLLGPWAGSRDRQVAGLLAVGFALWNVARWRQARLRRVTARRPRPGGDEYNPAFDFGRE